MAYYRKLYDRDELPSRAKLVYIYLYDRCDAERKAWPSVKTIAKELSISDKTVRRAIKDLEKRGLFARNMPSEKTARSQATVIFYCDSPRDWSAYYVSVALSHFGRPRKYSL